MKNLSNQEQKIKGRRYWDICLTNFVKALEAEHFSNITIQRHNSHLIRFKEYCIQNNCENFLSEQVITNYLNSMKSSKQIIQYSRTVLGRFRDFTLNKNFKTKYLKSSKIPLRSSEFLETLNTFNIYLSKSNIKTNTIRNQLISVEKFLFYLEKNNILIFNELSFEIVSKFINNLSLANASKYIISCNLKKFLNFTFDNKLTKFSGSQLFLNIKYNNKERIVSFYNTDEISRLISSINNDTAVGKRNYAIMLLASTLALRAGDISNLTIDNIDWDNKLITLTQQKTNKLLIQPITDEIFFALLDYLKNSRPTTNATTLFVSTRAPYKKLSSAAIYMIVQQCLKSTDIDISNRKHGPHALRHSFSNNMLHNNVSLQDISSSLGHTYLTTTMMYTNIDYNNLKLLCLEVE
ncbi:MAG: tyrosine-type recombinase/integrase [Clostridia bacterium]